MQEDKLIDYTYYFTLYDFDAKYYKLYDEYIYDNEAKILKLYNGIILPDSFKLSNKIYEYQILGDYYKYFRGNIDKAINYYEKAIKAGNLKCIIKYIITKYEKSSDKYYKELFKVLPNNICVIEYISNLFISCNDKAIINKYLPKIEQYIKNYKASNKNGYYYYFLKSSYDYYIKDYKEYVNTVKLSINSNNPLILCNFISNYYNTDNKLVLQLINEYFDKEEENYKNASKHIKRELEISNSLLYINLFIIYKIEVDYNNAIKYLIKAMNSCCNTKYIDISIIIANTEYNSLIDILFDNFHLVKLNSTYLELIDFRLLILLAYYYYNIDPIKYKFNYDFIQFYKNKILNIYNYCNDLNPNTCNTISNNILDIYYFSNDFINKYPNNFRYKNTSILNYLSNLLVYYNSYNDNSYNDNLDNDNLDNDNSDNYNNYYNLMKNINAINLDMIYTSKTDCMICYEKYNYLIKTKCNHYLCIKCLSGIINISSTSDICPYCRQCIF
jgi:hypothetical protein